MFREELRTWEKHFCDKSKNDLKAAAARELTLWIVTGASMGSDTNSEQIGLKNCDRFHTMPISLPEKVSVPTQETFCVPTLEILVCPCPQFAHEL